MIKFTSPTAKTLIIAGISLLFAIPSNAQIKDYPIKPVPFTHVHVNDSFWTPKLTVNAEVTIPYTLDKCEQNGRMDNFLRAAGRLPGDKLTQFTFDDTDVYKVIEGASYGLQVKENPKMEKYLDSLIGIVAAAQEPDGYLYTFRTVKTKTPHEWIGSKRWEKEEELSHELYNSGHLFESAVAHYQATGKKNLLNIAIKNADLLVRDFGPGKLQIYPGHQVVEIGLVKMYRATGNKAYLDLAKFFLDVRGPKGDPYNQAQARVVDQKEAVGHAVRAAYMYTGMADIAALTGDKEYLAAIDAIWKDVVYKKLYITGGIGATGNGEAFGDAYQLPNMSAYAETCAAIANVYWNSRMFQLHGESKYYDILERTLYNGLLSGVSLSGNRFFYPNPLASMHQHDRSNWFSCACCITNMARFLPSVPGYVYAQNGNNLYVNLFMSNKANIDLTVGNVKITQKTDYPWQGKVDLTVDPDRSANFALRIRIPGWATGQPVNGDLYNYMNANPQAIQITLNGKKVNYEMEKGYAVIKRNWKRGDLVSFTLPMTVQKVLANDKVKDDAGKFALERGPIVYCLEGPDNKDSLVHNILIDKSARVAASFVQNKLSGIEQLSVTGKGMKRQSGTEALLETEQTITAIPYFAWNNRGPSDMSVWVPYTHSAARPLPARTIASTSKVSASSGKSRLAVAINDQFDPADSRDANYPYLHWWPKKDTEEFVQYDFEKAATVSQSNVYWFDDGPWGGCRIPVNYRILYLKDDKWEPVKVVTNSGIEKDKFNTIEFEPVLTKGLRLELKLPADNAAGIHEWQVK